MALSLLVTLVGFLLGAGLARRLRLPLLNPVVVGVVVVLVYLRLSRLPYSTYVQQTQPLSVLLGPAVVALALPLHERTGLLRHHALAILLGIALACGLALALGWLTGALLHLDRRFVLALCSRSATAPIAMGIAERCGGAPTLSGALAILTGMTGATLGPPLLRWCGVALPLARGLAMGAVSHGIGTARVLEESEEAGAAAALGMCLNGIATALLLPYLWHLL